MNQNPFPEVKSNHTLDTEKKPSVRQSVKLNKLTYDSAFQNKGLTSFTNDSMMFKFKN